MLVTLGWMLLVGLPPTPSPAVCESPAAARSVRAGRVTIRPDRDDPYARGDGARVYLSVDGPSYVAVFRVETDGRIRALFPREPWTETRLDHQKEQVLAGSRERGHTFLVDDDPGMGYVFAIAATRPFDFRDITRGDRWDYRLFDGGRIRGDPYVGLTDLAARLVPDGDYDYDIAPYYVGRRYDYPRFVCYDCHAYAGYDEWNPYAAACTRYQVVIRDEPRYYPYRYGGRNVVVDRPAHPGPRFVFRDADPRRPAVSRAERERRGDDPGDPGRTSRDIGGSGAVAAPALPPLRSRGREGLSEPPTTRPDFGEARRAGRPGERPDGQPPRREHGDTAREAPRGLRPVPDAPQSTGEPELRRRRR